MYIYSIYPGYLRIRGALHCSIKRATISLGKKQIQFNLFPKTSARAALKMHYFDLFWDIILAAAYGVVSSTLYIVQILVHSHFDLVSWLLALEATEPVSEPVTQMAVELINNHLISIQQKR